MDTYRLILLKRHQRLSQRPTQRQNNSTINSDMKVCHFYDIKYHNYPKNTILLFMISINQHSLIREMCLNYSDE